VFAAATALTNLLLTPATASQSQTASETKQLLATAVEAFVTLFRTWLVYDKARLMDELAVRFARAML
jgi:hypothetical protein